MTERTKFCPQCGQEIEEGLGARGLCKDCYKEEETFTEVPKRIEIPQCPHCQAYLYQGDWKRYKGEKELIAEVLSDYDGISRGSFKEIEQGKELELTLTAEKKIDGRELKQKVKSQLIIKKRLCPICQKIESGYYEAIIQLREKESVDAEEDALKFILRENRNNNRKEDFISRVKEVKEGYNLYVSSRKYAEKLLKVLEEAYPLEKKDSRKLVGEKDGQRIYQSVKLARIIGNNNE